MAPLDLKYLEVFRNGRGKLVAYYRRGGRHRRLVDEIGTPVDPADSAAVVAAWQRAHHAHETADKAAADATEGRVVRPRSIADLIRLYRASDSWGEKAPGTRKDYEKALGPLERDCGHMPAIGLRRHHVAQIRARYAWRNEPVKGSTTGETQRVWNGRQANRVVTVLSILMTFAVESLGWRADNPALRPKRLKTEGVGYRPWMQDEFLQFFERANPEWQFAALLALLSAQRGQDQVAMRWADYDGTGLWVTQKKGRKKTRIWVECHPMLKSALDARKAAVDARELQRPAAAGAAEVTALTILTRPDGAPWGENAFQKAAGKAIRAAGLTEVVWHGLRGAAASWAADGGASEKGIQSLLGHRTATAAQRYMRGADQRRLAAKTAQSIVLPFDKNKAQRKTASRRGATSASHTPQDPAK